MIGPHVIGGISPHLDVIRRWQPRLLLLLDPANGAARAIKQVSPGTTIIGRVFKPDGEIASRIAANPLEAAQWAADTVLPFAEGNPDVDYWQFTNEVRQTSTNEIRSLNAFSIAYVDKLMGIGAKAAIGGFSVGNPKTPPEDPSQWAAFYPAMRYAKARGGILLLHAYGADSIFQPDDSWYLHRYEKRVIPHLPDDLKDMPYAYGEYGCDLGVKSIGDRRGWKTGYNRNWNAFGNDLLAASRFLANYPQCKGAAIFTLGNFGDWGDFDIAGDCANHLAGLPWAQPTQQPAPPPPVPVPPTGTVMIDLPSNHYSSRQGQRVKYIILHSTATPVGGTLESTANYLKQNERGVSIHELVGANIVYKMVADSNAAHHAESDTARLPGGEPNYLNNELTWGIEAFQIADTPVAPLVARTMLERVVEACRRLGIPSSRVLGHREIDPTRRSDPLGVDMVQFRRAVASALNEQTPPLSYTDDERAKAKWFTEQLARTLRGDADATATLISALISEPKKAGLHNVLVAKALPSLERV